MIFQLIIDFIKFVMWITEWYITRPGNINIKVKRDDMGTKYIILMPGAAINEFFM